MLKALDSVVTVVTCETGTGKSTEVVPLAYWNALVQDNEDVGGIVCTQPRRITCIGVSDRVAQNLDTSVGQTVGFQYRGARNVQTWTPIVYTTDGSLLVECANDPDVLGNKYRTAIIDEAHERTLNSDMLLCLVRSALERTPPPKLRVIIMSATLSAQSFLDYFAAFNPTKCVVGGNTPYRVRDLFETDEPRDDHDRWQRTRARIEQLAGRGQHTLVFLSGEQEIKDMRKALFSFARATRPGGRLIWLHTLYSKQSRKEQHQVEQSHITSNNVRVIPATNIAETGVTLVGIDAVVDMGVEKYQDRDFAAFASGVPECYISKASALQRRGRVGRTRPGERHCIYTQAFYNEEMEAERPAPITRERITQQVLQMCRARPGVPFEDLPLLEKAPMEGVQEAYAELLCLDCINKERRLTLRGERVLRLACDPRLAIMMLTGATINMWARSFAIYLAAVLELDDPERVLTESSAWSQKRYLLRYGLGDLHAWGGSALELLDPEQGFEPRGRKPSPIALDLSHRATEFHQKLRQILHGDGSVARAAYNEALREDYLREIVGESLKLQTAWLYGGKDYQVTAARNFAQIHDSSIVSSKSLQDLRDRAFQDGHPSLVRLAKQLEQNGTDVFYCYYWSQHWKPAGRGDGRSHWLKGIFMAGCEEIRKYNPWFAMDKTW